MTIDSADDLSSCIIQRLHIPLLSGSIAGELNFIDDLCEASDRLLIQPSSAQDLRDRATTQLRDRQTELISEIAPECT